jgi:hypothetical protein
LPSDFAGKRVTATEALVETVDPPTSHREAEGGASAGAGAGESYTGETLSMHQAESTNEGAVES